MGTRSAPEVAAVRPLVPAMRALLVLAGVLVMLAGVQLFVFPLRTDSYFAWTIHPPLTAVFLGASYWAAAAVEWTAATRRTWAEARVAVPGVLLFTTLTLVVTLMHLDRFHLGPEFAPATRAVTWAWLAIYAVVPVLMAALWLVQARTPGVDPPRARPLGQSLRVVSGVQAAVLLGVGAALLVVPASVAQVWPWSLTPLTGRAVGAWLVSMGVIALHALREGDLDRIRPAAAGSLAFAGLQLIALVRHGDDLRGGPGTVGYALLLASFLATGLMTMLAPRPST